MINFWESLNVLGNDEKIYSKMVGIWSITSIPDLQAKLVGDEIRFEWNKGAIVTMKFQLFDSLFPIELVNLIEKKMLHYYGVDATKMRNSLDGFQTDPFSSQNRR